MEKQGETKYIGWLRGLNDTIHGKYSENVLTHRKAIATNITARRSNQSILKKLSPEYSLEGDGDDRG